MCSDDDIVVMLNINIALLIFSHNMPLLPGTSDFCSSAAWCNLTPTRVLLFHTLAFIFQRSYWFCKHCSFRIIIQHILSLLYCARHSKKRLTSIFWIPTGANVAGHGCEISASEFKTINYFVEISTFLKVWEVDPFWYWWWGCETILQCRGLRRSIF